MTAWGEIADRVFVRRYAFFDQTIGAVIGRDGALVIDTRTTFPQADELLADLRALTADPVVAVLNTHHHYDHTFGNARFLPRPIWGHDRCAAVLRTDGEAMRRRVIAELPDLADELAEVAITPPDWTFAETATIDLGDRHIELRYLGLGHTDNDVVALVPDCGALFAGDLFENGDHLSFGDSFPVAWAETAARLLPLGDGPVVPGHGDVVDRAWAAAQAADLAALAALARDQVAGTITLDEALARAPFHEHAARVAFDRARLELTGS